MKKVILLIYFVAFGSALIFAQLPGDPDASFGTGGKVMIPGVNSYFSAPVLLSNSKVLYASQTIVAAGNSHAVTNYLCCLMPDGTPDMSFGSGGKCVIPVYGWNIRVQQDGKIIMLGIEEDELVMCRCLPEGKVDSTFGLMGKASTGAFFSFRDFAVQADGKILVGGTAFANSQMILSRFLPNGLRDFAFGKDGMLLLDFGPSDYESLSKIVIQPDGKVLLAGSQINSGVQTPILMRLTSEGRPDSTFSSDGKLSIAFNGFAPSALTLQRDGRIVLAGTIYYNTSSGCVVTRLMPDGTTDSQFGVQGARSFNFGGNYSNLECMVSQDDGKIIMAGSSDGSFGMARVTGAGAMDASFSADGKQTLSFGPGYWSGAYAAGILPDGKIFLGGSTYIDDTTQALSLARFISGIKVGQTELTLLPAARLFPNPVSGEAHVSYTLSATEAVSIELYDVEGKCVKTFVKDLVRNEGGHLEKLPTNDLLPGLYFLKIISSEGMSVTRLVKQQQ